MTKIRTVTLTPKEARDLEKHGFILKFKMMHIDGTDTFDVYVSNTEQQGRVYEIGKNHSD